MLNLQPLFEDLDERIKDLDGVDGFALFDEDCNLVNSTIDESILSKTSGHSLREILANNVKNLDESEQAVLMTEKAAWYLKKLGQWYVLILAGLRKPVDITQLVEFGAKIYV